MPYVIESPGPTFNTLGQDHGKPVIQVSGHETYPAAGSLDLTTVYVNGGPNGTVNISRPTGPGWTAPRPSTPKN